MKLNSKKDDKSNGDPKDNESFRRDRFINELTNKIKYGDKEGDICEDMGIIMIKSGKTNHQLDTDKTNPNSINNVKSSGNNEEEEAPELVSDPIDDELTDNYNETIRNKINEGFEYEGPKLDKEGNIIGKAEYNNEEEDEDEDDNKGDTKTLIPDKEGKINKKAPPNAVYRSEVYDNGFDMDTERAHPLTPHDDADKVVFNGRTDELYAELKLVEASVADIFNELTRRFDNTILLLKRPLIKVDEVKLDKHKANEGVDKKLYKRTGARNDRVVNFKMDNRSFCMGDPHALHGMLVDLKVKTEAAFMSQMDHFYYDGNIATTTKTSKLAMTRKKSGFKKKEKGE